jgi:hypothetical protein
MFLNVMVLISDFFWAFLILFLYVIVLISDFCSKTQPR